MIKQHSNVAVMLYLQILWRDFPIGRKQIKKNIKKAIKLRKRNTFLKSSITKLKLDQTTLFKTHCHCL